MNTTQALISALNAHPDAKLHVILPDEDVVPAHFHVTEVGRVQKDFVDCGGTVRSKVHCQMQLLVAHDVDHRLTAGKLARIMEASAPILKGDDLPIVMEHEDCRTIAFLLREFTATPEQITFQLDLPHPACLAEDACGLGLESDGTVKAAAAGESCCTPGSGCC